MKREFYDLGDHIVWEFGNFKEFGWGSFDVVLRFDVDDDYRDDIACYVSGEGNTEVTDAFKEKVEIAIRNKKPFLLKTKKLDDVTFEERISGLSSEEVKTALLLGKDVSLDDLKEEVRTRRGAIVEVQMLDADNKPLLTHIERFKAPKYYCLLGRPDLDTYYFICPAFIFAQGYTTDEVPQTFEEVIEFLLKHEIIDSETASRLKEK